MSQWVGVGGGKGGNGRQVSRVAFWARAGMRRPKPSLIPVLIVPDSERPDSERLGQFQLMPVWGCDSRLVLAV